MWVSGSEGKRSGELSLPPAQGSTGWPTQSSAGELSLVVRVRGIQQADQLRYHQAQIQGSGLAHPSIYITYGQLGCKKTPVL